MITCKECGKQLNMIQTSHFKTKCTGRLANIAEYRREFPNEPLRSDEVPTLHEVLYEFEGPRIFTTLDSGLLQFWYQCGEDSERVRYLVVPASNDTIAKLKEGSRTVHDVLAQPWIWAVETDLSRRLLDCWVLGGLNEVPAHAKPKPNVMLWPHLKPLLWRKAPR